MKKFQLLLPLKIVARCLLILSQITGEELFQLLPRSIILICTSEIAGRLTPEFTKSVQYTLPLKPRFWRRNRRLFTTACRNSHPIARNTAPKLLNKQNFVKSCQTRARGTTEGRILVGRMRLSLPKRWFARVWKSLAGARCHSHTEPISLSTVRYGVDGGAHK